MIYAIEINQDDLLSQSYGYLFEFAKGVGLVKDDVEIYYIVRNNDNLTEERRNLINLYLMKMTSVFAEDYSEARILSNKIIDRKCNGQYLVNV